MNRVGELEGLSTLLGAYRLVSIIGTYGIGKTRLAVRHGWVEHDLRAAKVVFCDLTSATTAEDLVACLQAALFGTQSPDAALLDARSVGLELAAEGEVLVILDNFEHLLDRGPPIVSLWLGLAPLARFLVTSRERLRLADEACVQLGPLSTPEAVEFLTERVRRLAPDFSVDDAGRGALTRICEQLDGLPLALEMTAPWLQVLSAAELSQHLQDGFRLLHDGRPSTRHHASLESAIGWSWDLLSPGERDFMGLAAIFRGRFTVEDAVAVVAPPGGSAGALTLVRRLCERSLLSGLRNPAAGRVEFSMSLSVRQFATAHLVAGSGAVGLEARHRAHIIALAAHHLGLLERLPWSDNPQGIQAIAELERISADLVSLRDDVAAAPSPIITRALAAIRVLPVVPRRADPAPVPPGSHSVELSLDSRADRVRIDGATPVSLGRRGPIRQILLGLVDRARKAPNEIVSLVELNDLGWPGEQMTPESASNRVYTALSVLRRLGFDKVITTRRGGWLIEPGVKITLLES